METPQQVFTAIPIENVAAYWNARPCNIRHSDREVGGREYYDEVEARKYFVEPHIPGFAEFERWRGKKVLEIGCGIGTDTMNFARAGARVTAVDLSEESLSLARRRAEIFGLNVTFYQANAEELTKVVPVEEYDLVYSFGVIHHTPHPERAVEQIKNYLGPDSVFKIMVYNLHSWKVFWILMKYGYGRFWRLPDLVAKNSEAQTGCPVTYAYTAKTVMDLLKGFKADEIRADHIFPYSIPEYKRYEYKKVWYFRYLPDSWFRGLEKRFGWHLLASVRPDWF
jgi:2-polyprenyl-3-methyl-5-hydroxy-6-metoxy-1,4-benzoquinol methylase